MTPAERLESEVRAHVRNVTAYAIATDGAKGRTGAVAATVRRRAIEAVRRQLLAGGVGMRPEPLYDTAYAREWRRFAAGAASPLSAMRTKLVDTAHKSRFCTPSILPDGEIEPLRPEYETSLSDRELGSATEGNGVFGTIEKRLAKAHGAALAFPFVDGSTGAIRAIAEWIATWYDGPLVGVNRIAHKSVVHALDAHGVGWYYLDEPTWDPDFDAVGPPRAGAMQLLEGTSHVWINSVTYEGVITDVAAIRQRLDDWSGGDGRRPVLIADEAWGAHLRFDRGLTRHRALRNGADIVTFSTHKAGGARQGTAVLTIAATLDPGDRHRLRATVRGTVSTSPNLPLLASLEVATELLRETDGRPIRASGRLADDLARRLAATDLVRPPDEPRSRPQRFARSPVVDRRPCDPLKVVVHLGGRSGFHVSTAFDDHKVVVEKEGFASLVFLVPFQVDEVDVAAAVDAAVEIAAMTDIPAAMRPGGAPFCPTGRRPEPPRGRATAEAVPVSTARGRVAVDVVAAYPPGIPVIVPGDEIAEEQVAYLVAVGRAGGHVVSGAGAGPRKRPLVFVLPPQPCEDPNQREAEGR